jgi:hypothetical protein
MRAVVAMVAIERDRAETFHERRLMIYCRGRRGDTAACH